MAGLLDFNRPVAVLMIGVLHFYADDIAEVMCSYTTPRSAGSMLALNHTSDDHDDHDDPAVAAWMRAACDAYRGSATEATIRNLKQITSLLEDLKPVQPGLVDIGSWPSEESSRAPCRHLRRGSARRNTLSRPH